MERFLVFFTILFLVVGVILALLNWALSVQPLVVAGRVAAGAVVLGVLAILIYQRVKYGQ